MTGRQKEEKRENAEQKEGKETMKGEKKNERKQGGTVKNNVRWKNEG